MLANGINDAGEVVGFFFDPDGNVNGYLYDNGTYTTLDVPSASSTQAQGINDAGQIVGSFSDGSGSHAFLYSNGVYTLLDDPLATGNTQALSINNAGQIAGTYSDATGNHGFVATPTPASTYTVTEGDEGAEIRVLATAIALQEQVDLPVHRSTAWPRRCWMRHRRSPRRRSRARPTRARR